VLLLYYIIYNAYQRFYDYGVTIVLTHSYCADLQYATMESCMCNANEQMNQADCFSNMKWGGMMQVFPRCSKGF